MGLSQRERGAVGGLRRAMGRRRREWGAIEGVGLVVVPPPAWGVFDARRRGETGGGALLTRKDVDVGVGPSTATWCGGVVVWLSSMWLVSTGLASTWLVSTGHASTGFVSTGARVDVAVVDGAHVDGPRVNGTVVGGPRVDGAVVDGSRVDGVRVDVARVDGARVDVAVVDVVIVDVAGRRGSRRRGGRRRAPPPPRPPLLVVVVVGGGSQSRSTGTDGAGDVASTWAVDWAHRGRRRRRRGCGWLR